MDKKLSWKWLRTWLKEKKSFISPQRIFLYQQRVSLNSIMILWKNHQSLFRSCLTSKVDQVDPCSDQINPLSPTSPDQSTTSLVTPIFTLSQLISWAMEISRGMEYLSSKGVVHGDLAARNVLLSGTRKANMSSVAVQIGLAQCWVVGSIHG